MLRVSVVDELTPSSKRRTSLRRGKPQGILSRATLKIAYKTIVKTASATTMPAAKMPIFRISRGNVRA